MADVCGFCDAIAEGDDLVFDTWTLTSGMVPRHPPGSLPLLPSRRILVIGRRDIAGPGHAELAVAGAKADQRWWECLRSARCWGSVST